MPNNQLPEKAFFLEDGSLQVHSIFKTIQGEGPFTGQRAIFVRLAGCNLQCPLCDTDYTSHRGIMKPDEIVKAVEHYAHGSELAEEWASIGLQELDSGYLVVITGGEPFRQFLRPTVEALLAKGFGVQLETNGTLFQDLPYDDIVVVCSPKTGSLNTALIPYLQCLKYVICANDVSDVDGLPLSALGHPCGGRLARPSEYLGSSIGGTMILIQPADEQDEEKNRKNLEAAVKSVLDFGYTLQLQTQKIIGVL